MVKIIDKMLIYSAYCIIIIRRAIMKLSVGKKIMGIVVLMAVIVLGIAYMGNSSTTTVQTEFEDLVNISATIQLEAWQLRAEQMEKVADVRGFMLYKTQAYLDGYNKICEEQDKVFGEIIALTAKDAGHGAELKTLLDSMKANDDKYEENCAKIFPAVLANDSETITKYATIAKGFLAEFLKASEELDTLVAKDKAEVLAKVEADAVSAERMIYIIGVIMAVVGLAAGWFVSRSISLPLGQLAVAAGKIAEGALNVEVPSVKTGDEVEDMANAFRNMAESLRKVLTNVSQASETVSSTSGNLAENSTQVSKATQQVSAAMDSMAKGITDQAQEINNTVETIGQLVMAIEQVATGAQEQNKNVIETMELVQGMADRISVMSDKIQQVKTDAQRNGDVAKEGGSAVKMTVVGMGRVKDAVFDTAGRVRELGEKSQQIGEIVQVIDDIAEQTNLLALNAAIEAARAGEHGKGFAVVADEVRKLAERSGKATKEIADLIMTIQKETEMAVHSMEQGTKEVEQGVQVAQKAGEALEEIVTVVKEGEAGVLQIVEIINEVLDASKGVTTAIGNVAAITEENSAATEEMSASAGHISGAMEGVAAITEQNAGAAEEVSASTEEMMASTEEIAAYSDSLAKMAGELNTVLKVFKF
jgi:methyl-accepting chemotaxis protein